MPEQNEEAPPAGLERLLEQLDLESIDNDTFEGEPGDGWRRLFGGHVAAQAVIAAYRTVSEGAIHSLHSYFVRAGGQDEPIRYVVHRIRDGRTFTTRDVVAYQSDKAIFNLSCSFAKPEPGVSRSPEPPSVPEPEGLPSWGFPFPGRPEDRARMASFERDSAIELRGVDGVAPPPTDMPRRRVWMRVRGVAPEDPAIHAALLTYASETEVSSRRPTCGPQASGPSAPTPARPRASIIRFGFITRLASTTGCCSRARARSRMRPVP